MRGKARFTHALTTLFVTSVLSLGLVNSTVGNAICTVAYPIALFVTAVAVAGGAFTFPSRDFACALLLGLSLALFMFSRIRVMTSLSLCFEPQRIVSIEGRTVYDSSLTEKGNHMMKIMLSGCRSVCGDSGSASGLVTVIGDRVEIISSGTRVRLYGRFSDTLFVYERIQVIARGRVNDIREYLISLLEHRMAFLKDHPSTLSALLLFGRSDYGSSPIRELARNCGCSHILALSGMHLGILASMCRRLFGKRHLGICVSMAAVLAFVFIAGARPSLVRAALAFALPFVDTAFRPLAVFLLQMVLFPASMTELGCCYGYVAVSAIVCLSPYIKAMLFQWLGKASNLLSATLSVMVLSAPIQLLFDGKWHPAAIVASPVAAFLAACSMVLGLLLLAFGRMGFLVRLNGHVYQALEGMFSLFGAWPSAGWKGYALFVAALALALLVSAIVRKTMRSGCGMIFNSFP